jgi:hypothetical protein
LACSPGRSDGDVDRALELVVLRTMRGLMRLRPASR